MAALPTDSDYRGSANSKVRLVAMADPRAQDIPVHSALDSKGGAWDGPHELKG